MTEKELVRIEARVKSLTATIGDTAECAREVRRLRAENVSLNKRLYMGDWGSDRDVKEQSELLADERERCAQAAEEQNYGQFGKLIAAAIRGLK